MSEVRITDPVTGGQKGQKPERFALIPWEALRLVSRVYAFGAAKYAEDHNWRRGYRWSLSFDALLRHVSAPLEGEWLDKESGLPHLAHAVFHCLTLIVFEMFGLGTDDRAPSPTKALDEAADKVIPPWDIVRYQGEPPTWDGEKYVPSPGTTWLESDPFKP